MAGRLRANGKSAGGSWFGGHLLREVEALKLFERITLAELVVFWLGIVLIYEAVCFSQSPVKLADHPLTFDQAVDFALANYPAVRASIERALASKEGVSLSRTTYLPRTDLPKAYRP